MRRCPAGAAVAALLVVGLAAVLTLKCYRETTMGAQRMKAGFDEMKARNFGRAKQRFAEAREAGADPVTCLMRIAECEIGAGEYDQAIATCNALQFVPDGAAWAHTFRGVALERQGKRALARLEYQLAVANGNDHASVNIAMLDKGAKR